MTKQSVSAAGDSSTNEELVLKLQDGDLSAPELLLRRNSDHLTALTICLNYNGPSGAENTYKRAIRTRKQNLQGGAYGVWLDVQWAIRETQRQAKRSSYYSTPQKTWNDNR